MYSFSWNKSETVQTAMYFILKAINYYYLSESSHFCFQQFFNKKLKSVTEKYQKAETYFKTKKQTT